MILNIRVNIKKKSYLYYLKSYITNFYYNSTFFDMSHVCPIWFFPLCKKFLTRGK
jgi:hypothetical protein